MKMFHGALWDCLSMNYMCNAAEFLALFGIACTQGHVKCFVGFWNEKKMMERLSLNSKASAHSPTAVSSD